MKAFTQDKQAEFLEHVRAGMQRGAAADLISLDRTKIREFIATHKDFEALVLDAEVDATEHVQEALYQAAISGNVTAAKTWLEMHGSDRERSSVAKKGDPDVRPVADGDFGDLDRVLPIDAARRRRDSR